MDEHKRKNPPRATQYLLMDMAAIITAIEFLIEQERALLQAGMQGRYNPQTDEALGAGKGNDNEAFTDDL